MPFLPQPSQFILAWDMHWFMLACIPGGLVKGTPMTRMGVSGWVFLLVPGCPGTKAVKRLCVCVCVCVRACVRVWQHTMPCSSGSSSNLEQTAYCHHFGWFTDFNNPIWTLSIDNPSWTLTTDINDSYSISDPCSDHLKNSLTDWPKAYLRSQWTSASFNNNKTNKQIFIVP